MSEQWSAKWTKLSSPVMIGATQYSHALRFFSTHSNQPADFKEILQVAVVSVTELPGNKKRIVLNRGTGYSSRTVTIGPGNSSEVSWPYRCGGNACETGEDQRGISYINPYFTAGPDGATKAQPADSVWVGKEAWMVLSTKALAQPGADGVKWHPGSDIPWFQDFYNDSNAITYSTSALGDLAEFYFAVADPGIWGGSSAKWKNSGTLATGDSTRVIFTPPGGAPYTEYYPKDASFSETDPEYWVNPITGNFRISTSHILWGDLFEITAWSRGTADISSVVHDEVLAFEVTGSGTGYGSTSDQLLMQSIATSTDFDRTFTVDGGGGSVEWRTAVSQDAIRIRLSWNGSAVITGASCRHTAGGADSSFSPLASTYSFPFQVRVIKTGGDLTVQHRQHSGDTWVTAGVTTVSGIETNTDGVLSLAASAGGFRWSSDALDPNPGTVKLVSLGLPGIHGIRRMQSFSAAVFTGRTLEGSAGDILTVVNQDTGEEMVLFSATHTRNVYDISGDTLYVYSESAGDLISIVYTGLTAPPGTGRPPLVYNQTNLATPTGDGSESTTNIYQNRLNWHDTITIHDPLGTFNHVPGTVLSIRRGCVFDSTNPPDIQRDIKNGEGTWDTIAPGNYRLYAAEGLVLLSKAYMDALIEGIELLDHLCFKAVGVRFRHGAGIEAKQFNEPRAVLSSLDQLWCQIPVGGETPTVSGITSDLSIGATGFNCDIATETFIWTGVAWGTRKFNMLSLPLNGSLTSFYDYDEHGTVYREESSLGTVPTYPDSNLLCPAIGGRTPDVVSINGETVADEYQIYTSRDGDITAGVNFKTHWGRKNYRYETVDGVPTVVSDEGVSPRTGSFFGGFPNSGGCWSVTDIAAAFKFQGIPFTVSDLLSRLPSGATIIEAFLEVKFDGFRSVQWTSNFTVGPAAKGAGVRPYANWTYSENGHLIANYFMERSPGGVLVEDSFFDPILPDPIKHGAVGFKLIGRRKNTQNVTRWDGTRLLSDSSVFHALGGSIGAATAEDGKWGLYPVTGPLQALLANRDSGMSDFFFWPTAGGIDADETNNGLAGFLKHNIPGHAASLESGGAGETGGFSASAAGAFHWFSTLTVGTLLVRFRVGNILSQAVIPLIQPRMIP